MNSEIKTEPFSWNDNFSEEALEDFQLIQKGLSYVTCQSIGLALAKLKILEKQGCKVDEGKTAITRAENDEILNEAWSLLVNVTEEDGVTTAEANGMLKLMNFFFYKYHGLKKKPEWVESVEIRLKERQEVATNREKAIREFEKKCEERILEVSRYHEGDSFNADRVIRNIRELLPRDKEKDQNHKSEADKMKEVGEWFGQGIEKGLKSTEEENK